MPLKYIFLLLSSVVFVASCTNKSPEKKDQVTPIQEESSFVMPELPSEIMFCGKKVVMDNFDIRERLDKELIVNTFFHSSTIQAFKRSNRYFPLIEQILEEENLPEDFKYLCLIESGLAQVTSPSGAKGFWQFMPATGKEYGLRIDREVDERLHIEKSTRAACAYLKDANENFNDWILTAASYNMGVGGIRKELENQEVEDYFDLYLNNETSRYIFRILALKIIFENAESYGFVPGEMELYDPIETRNVEVSESIENLMHWAKEQGANYRQLKLLNPWLISNKLTVKGMPVIIRLPKK